MWVYVACDLAGGWPERVSVVVKDVWGLPRPVGGRLVIQSVPRGGGLVAVLGVRGRLVARDGNYVRVRFRDGQDFWVELETESQIERPAA